MSCQHTLSIVCEALCHLSLVTAWIPAQMPRLLLSSVDPMCSQYTSTTYPIPQKKTKKEQICVTVWNPGIRGEQQRGQNPGPSFWVFASEARRLSRLPAPPALQLPRPVQASAAQGYRVYVYMCVGRVGGVCLCLSVCLSVCCICVSRQVESHVYMCVCVYVFLDR